MPQLVSFDFVRNRRSWSNYPHVPRQDVQKLRHLVEAGASQNSSNARDPRIGEQFVSWLLFVAEVGFGSTGNESALIFTVRSGVSTGLHRAKLVQQKQPAIHADALLRVENRAL